MATLSDNEKKQLGSNAEFIERAEFMIANGVGRHKAISSVQKWAKAGADPKDDPVRATVPDKAPGFFARMLGRGTKPAGEEAKTEAPGEEAEEEEEGDEGESDLEEDPRRFVSPTRVFTETASALSDVTAGTGNPLAAGAAKVAPKTKVREVREAAGSGRKTKKSAGDPDWSAFANEILDGLSYVGFDTVAIRAKAKEEMDFQDVIRALAIYTRIGNSAKRRLKKGVLKSDAAVEEATEFLREMGISARVKGTDKISLPRLAQSFAPILRVMRAGADGMLDQRVDSSTPLELQDVAFGGYYTEANDFHTKFGRILGKWEASQKKETYDEAATDLRNKQFQELSAKGLLRDGWLAVGVREVADWRAAELWFNEEPEPGTVRTTMRGEM